jgi:hypothetical protein
MQGRLFVERLAWPNDTNFNVLWAKTVPAATTATTPPHHPTFAVSQYNEKIAISRRR